MIEFGAMLGTRFLTKRKPALRNIPHPFQLPLHFGMLGFHEFCTRILRHVNWRGEQYGGTRKWSWQQEMIPGLLKSLAAIHADVKDQDRASRFPRQHHRSRLRHVTRPAWAIDRERAIHSYVQPPRHHCQSSQSSARRTTLRRAESQPLNHFARPLPVERRRVHHYHAVVSVPPHNRENDSVPKRPDASLARSMHPFRMLPAQHLITQRRTQHSNHAVHRRGDNGNLDAPRPRQVRQPYVVMHINW